MSKRYIDIDALIERIKRDVVTLSPDAAEAKEFMLDHLDMERFVPTADVVEIPEGGIGNLSDGYHTFNELYHHRAILFSVICNSMPDKAWKSKKHDTGDMYEGMFIVGIETPKGQATYHYDIHPYWDMFKVKELEYALKWDGHTPQDAIDRISRLSADVAEIRYGDWEMQRYPMTQCSVCGATRNCERDIGWRYCPNCGAKMDGERGEE